MRYLDLSRRAKFRVVGPDALRYLNGQLTNDLRPLASDASRAVYAFALTAKGKLAGDLYVRAWDGGFLVDADATLRELLLARLERYAVADDVAFEDLTERLRLWHWPDLVDRPDRARGDWFYQVARLRSAGADVIFPADDLPPLEGSVPLDDAEAETRRIAEGIPRWGHELDENTLPQEAGMDERAISYTKGCYLGQEVVSRIKSIGHVNRRLTGLRIWDATHDLGVGARLVGTHDPAKVVGSLTSVAPLVDASGRRAALAYTRRGSVSPGDRLAVWHPETSRLLAHAEVSSLASPDPQ